jgi:hypothetical protein
LRADEQESPVAQIAHSQERLPSKDDALVLSLVPAPPGYAVEAPAKKWTAGRTLQFALISCGLFWLAVLLLAWAYLHVR